MGKWMKSRCQDLTMPITARFAARGGLLFSTPEFCVLLVALIGLLHALKSGNYSVLSLPLPREVALLRRVDIRGTLLGCLGLLAWLREARQSGPPSPPRPPDLLRVPSWGVLVDNARSQPGMRPTDQGYYRIECPLQGTAAGWPTGLLDYFDDQMWYFSLPQYGRSLVWEERRSLAAMQLPSYLPGRHG